MSQYYDLGGETLWNPSNGASRMFLRQVAVFEAEIGLPSGIGPMEADESQIDPAAFEVFVNALLVWHRRTQHAVMHALGDGFVVTVPALAERAGVDVRWDVPRVALGDGAQDVQVLVRPSAPTREAKDEWASRLRERVRDMAGFMAR
jgi:hypothetical protein